MRSLVAAFRRPTQVTTPVPFAPRHAAGWAAGWALPVGQEAQMRAMGTVGTLFAIVGGYAEDVSQVGWKLYRKPRASGDRVDRVEVLSHAALDLWKRPNPFMPRQEFVETIQQHHDLVGEQWWVLVKIGGLPIEMWPVRPDRMTPVPHPERFLTGYIYTGPEGQQVPLRLDEVIQVRRPNPLDPYRGMGPVQTILATLDSTRYSMEWNRNFFLNSAEPGGIIQVDRRLSDDEFNEMTSRWEEQHRGVARAHRVAVIEQGEWVDRKFSQRDMQFVELAEVNDSTIRKAYRYPKPMLGDVEDVNRATAEAMQVIYGWVGLRPRLERIKAALNGELLPMYGSTAVDLEFDYDSPVPADREADDRERDSQAAAAVALVAAGYDPDDVADWVGLPRMKFTPPPAPTLPALPPGQAKPGQKAIGHVHDGRLHFGNETSDEPDLSGVLDDLTSALDQLETDYAPTLADQIDSLVEQVEAAVDDDTVSNDLAALAAVAVPAAMLGAGVARRALDRIVAAAAGRAVDEAAAEDVTVEQDDVDEAVEEETAETAAVATVVVTLVAAGLAAAAAREALRVWTPGADGKEVAGKVRAYLEGLKGTDRRTAFGAMLHRGTNLGRAAAFREALKVKVGGKIFASEQNDVNGCRPCKDWDGHRFATLADAREMYDTGGYPLCLGRERCRGIYYVTWR